MTKILSIETSCDETSVAVLNWSGARNYSVLSHITNSQILVHQKYGGVFPALAKREHQKNMIPILFQSLQESSLLEARTKSKPMSLEFRKKLKKILEREPEVLEKITLLAEQYKTPKISAVAVTYGPGLEIALWTGFNTARALALVWGCDLVPTNHMEGHLYAALVQEKTKEKFAIQKIQYPSLGLLISGGHTELVLMKEEHKYKLIGQTLDDAVGEAYDKSARLLGIPYPGGVRVSQMAELVRTPNLHKKIHLIRHGQSTANASTVYAGAQDSPLTNKGISQAKQIARKLSKKPISLVVSSVLSRAVDTGGHIAKATGAQTVQNKIFNELHLGTLQGKSKVSDGTDIFETITRGYTKETPSQIIDRCKKAWTVLYTHAKKTDGEVVLAAHGILLVCMVATLRGATGENLVSQCRKIGRMDNADELIVTLKQLEEFLYPSAITLPRPMLHSGDYNFSFSGLKTAVRNVVQRQTRMSKKFKQGLCLELENAVCEVLISKTCKAIKQYGIQELVIGGGVSANTHIRRDMKLLCSKHGVALHLPELSLAGDNALMINLAGYRRWKQGNYPKRVTKVKGNLKLH